MNITVRSVAFALLASTPVALACEVTQWNRAHEVARVALGVESGPRFAYVPRDLIEHPDKAVHLDGLCYHVARALADSANGPDEWGMGSDDGESVIELLRCVATKLGATRLPQLELAYVGKPEHEQEARALVEQWGARFVFVTDPDDATVPPTLQALLDRNCPST